MPEERRGSTPGALTDDDYAEIAGMHPALWHLSSELHHLVAGFAGRLPDELVAQLRRWIGAGDLEGVTEAIALSALALGLAVTSEEARAIATLPAAFERSSDLPEGLVVTDAPTGSPFGFAAGAPAGRTEDGPTDPVDCAAFQALYQSPDAVALRRAVREATDRAPERRVYLFEAEPGTVLWRVAADAQEALEAAGEAAPQVEVYWTGEEPTEYQRAALQVATPLWVRPSLPRRIGTAFGRAFDQPGRKAVFEWFHWTPEVWDDLTSLHRILQRHAVEMPALMLYEARRLLAIGDLAKLAEVLAEAVAEHRAGWTDDELDVVRGIPAKVEADDVDLTGLDAGIGAAGSRSARTIVPAAWRVAEDDDTDDPVLMLELAMAERPGVRRLWRTWVRVGDDEPILFVLVEVEPGIAAWDVAFDVMLLLVAEGEMSDADAFWPGTELPALYREALESAELVWSADDPDAASTGGIRVAEMYDLADEHGQPRFAPDRPRIDDLAERRRLVSRMDAGEVVVTVGEWLAPDLLDPGHDQVVPVDYRGDGEWIWRDSATYYLEEYGIAPSAPLLEHLRAMERGAD